jgi:hypothetical protein
LSSPDNVIEQLEHTMREGVAVGDGIVLGSARLIRQPSHGGVD